MSNGRFISAPTIERSRRCQNCIHWDNGPTAQKHYEICRLGDAKAHAIRTLEREGQLPKNLHPTPERIGADDPTFKEMSENFAMGDSYMKAGVLGICKRGVPEGDFVHAMYLCNQWTGRTRPDDADKGDLTADEAREKHNLDG
jgi:hypothetical protein